MTAERGRSKVLAMSGTTARVGSAPDGERTSCPWCGNEARVGRDCVRCFRRVRETRVGTELLGKYRVESLIGQGGMANVFRARTLEDQGEDVAVKFLFGQLAAHPETRARFQRESSVLQRLEHPGIVSIRATGEHEGTPFLVMELVEGRTLEARCVATKINPARTSGT